jgi:hypothetical protein
MLQENPDGAKDIYRNGNTVACNIVEGVSGEGPQKFEKGGR